MAAVVGGFGTEIVVAVEVEVVRPIVLAAALVEVVAVEVAVSAESVAVFAAAAARHCFECFLSWESDDWAGQYEVEGRQR